MTAAAFPPVLLLGPFGATELLIILGIVILIFGASKLPQLGAGLGEGIRNFRKSMKSIGGSSAADSGEAGEAGEVAKDAAGSSRSEN